MKEGRIPKDPSRFYARETARTRPEGPVSMSVTMVYGMLVTGILLVAAVAASTAVAAPAAQPVLEAALKAQGSR